MKYIKELAVALMAILLYWQVLQTLTDEDAMLQGKNASEALATSIYNQVIENNLYSANYAYFIDTSTSQSSLFSVTDQFSIANSYSMYGCWWLSNNAKSWNGIYRDLGINFNVGVVDLSDAILNSDEFINMSTFPQKGSIKLSDGYGNVVIIKLATQEQ